MEAAGLMLVSRTNVDSAELFDFSCKIAMSSVSESWNKSYGFRRASNLFGAPRFQHLLLNRVGSIAQGPRYLASNRWRLCSNTGVPFRDHVNKRDTMHG